MSLNEYYICHAINHKSFKVHILCSFYAFCPSNRLENTFINHLMRLACLISYT